MSILNRYFDGDGVENVKFPEGAKGLTYFYADGYWTAYDNAGISVSVYDAVALTEYAEFAQEFIQIYVYEAEYVVINEQVDILDEVVEVGIVAEYNYVVEHLWVILDTVAIHDDDAWTDIFVTDHIAINTPPVADLNIYVQEFEISIAEYFDYIFTFDLIVSENVAVNEYSYASTAPDLGVDVGEDVDVGLYDDELTEDIYCGEYVDVLPVSLEPELHPIELVSVIEDAIIDVEQLAPNEITVDDDSSVYDYLQIVIPECNVDVYEAITIEEDIIALTGSAIFAVENILVQEYAEILDLVIELEAVQGVTVAEFYQVSLDFLFVNVMDLLSVSEFIQILDIIVELGPVFDVLAVAEDVAGYLDVQNFAVYEALALAEVAILDVSVEFTVFSTVSVAETVEMDLTIGIVVSEQITASESAGLEVPINASVVDLVAIADEVEASLDALFIDTLDPYHVLITEHVDVLDLVVEVGVVMEALGVLDEVSAYLDVLNIEISEDINVAEQFENVVFPLYVSVGEAVAVTENIDLFLDVLNVSEFEILVVTEDLALVLDVLNIENYDQIAVTETIEVLDIIVELGPVAEDVTVNENVYLYLDVLNSDILDDISIDEIFYRNMPINFEVAEQRGICLVTVSGW